MRRGGTAGIYVVVMALSWWIKSQLVECDDGDVNAWTAVDDISWVIHQMTEGSTPPMPVQKRGLEADGDDKKAQSKEVYVDDFCPLCFIDIHT